MTLGEFPEFSADEIKQIRIAVAARRDMLDRVRHEETEPIFQGQILDTQHVLESAAEKLRAL